jgi:hypothetical protein
MLSLGTSFFDTTLCLALKLSPRATLGHLSLKHIEHFHSQAKVQFHSVL